MIQTYQRTGVILAAGMGTRLQETDDTSRIKPLALLNGKPLILYTLESLRAAGCGKVVVVLGWEAERTRQAILDLYEGPLKLVFAQNTRYDLQNGVSVLSAREHVGNDFILTMADHWFEEGIMRRVRGHNPPDSGATLCVDYKVDSIFDMDDATKVLEHGGRIVAIGKGLSRYNCIDTGLFVCTAALFEALDQAFRDKGDVSLSEGIQALADQGRMKVLDIGEARWQDVDTRQMMVHAETLLKRSEGP